jgi:hypothetical protein
MIFPCGCELLRPAQSAQPSERHRMLDIDGTASSKVPADESGGSGDHVLDREHVDHTRLIVQRTSPQQRVAECAEQVDADRTRFVDQLQ